jgi:ADP-ribose pyrophosphatase
MTDIPTQDKELYQGNFLSILSAGSWEYVHRTNSNGVIAIVPITRQNEIVMIYQYRPPLRGLVVELPAGLVGDEPGAEHESLLVAAERELLEETGYRAGKIEQVFTGASSAGLTDEMITFFLATELNREGPGGGVDDESIETIVVPLDEVDQQLAEMARSGYFIDAKLLTGLYLARNRKDP